MACKKSPITRLLLAGSLVAAFLVVPDLAAPAEACATQHGDAYLAGFEGGDLARPRFYKAAENSGSAPFAIAALIHGCAGAGEVRVSWRTAPGSAIGGTDYQTREATTPDLNQPACNETEDCSRRHNASVSVMNDGVAEDVAEHFQISISTNNGRIVPPSTGRVYIIDDDGSPRVAFGVPLEPHEQSEIFPTARIPVFRAGNAAAAATVNWTLTGGNGAADYSPTSGALPFAANERLRYIQINVNNDSLREGNETITASLTSANGATVASPSTAAFTILDNDSDSAPPAVRFHHPRQGIKYERGDFRLREMHSIVRHDLSGVRSVEMALRQRKMSGSCRWWNGSRFKAGRCGARQWISMQRIGQWTPSSDVYGRRFPPLTPSIGTSIRNYTAWTRAKDRSGNETRTFQRRVNLSTFEVKRG